MIASTISQKMFHKKVFQCSRMTKIAKFVKINFPISKGAQNCWKIQTFRLLIFSFFSSSFCHRIILFLCLSLRIFSSDIDDWLTSIQWEAQRQRWKCHSNAFVTHSENVDKLWVYFKCVAKWKMEVRWIFYLFPTTNHKARVALYS